MMLKSYEEEKVRPKFTKMEKDFMAEIDLIVGPTTTNVQEQEEQQRATMEKQKLLKKFGLNNLGLMGGLSSPNSRHISSQPAAIIPKGDQSVTDLNKAEDGRVSIMNDSDTVSQRKSPTPCFKVIPTPSQIAAMYPKLVRKNLRRQNHNVEHKTHFKSNVLIKKKLLYAELDQWDQRRELQAADLLERGKNMVGDFNDHLNEPIKMHSRIDDNDVGFLSHVSSNELYELDHGFQVNNIYMHGRKMVIDDNKWDTTLKGLETRDPRLTKSATDLLALLDEAVDVDVDVDDEEEQSQDKS